MLKGTSRRNRYRRYRYIKTLSALRLYGVWAWEPLPPRNVGFTVDPSSCLTRRTGHFMLRRQIVSQHRTNHPNSVCPQMMTTHLTDEQRPRKGEEYLLYILQIFGCIRMLFVPTQRVLKEASYIYYITFCWAPRQVLPWHVLEAQIQLGDVRQIQPTLSNAFLDRKLDMEVVKQDLPGKKGTTTVSTTNPSSAVSVGCNLYIIAINNLMCVYPGRFSLQCRFHHKTTHQV